MIGPRELSLSPPPPEARPGQQSQACKNDPETVLKAEAMKPAALICFSALLGRRFCFSLLPTSPAAPPPLLPPQPLQFFSARTRQRIPEYVLGVFGPENFQSFCFKLTFQVI